MTKKDYELIASAIKQQWVATVKACGKGERSIQVHHTASRIADALAQDNPSFDRNRFLAACGVAV